MAKGISLLEVIVVIAIVAILSLFSVNNINNFRAEASIDNAASELVSTLRVARSKSMNGELLSGETEDEFDPDGLPEYGLTVNVDNYKLIRKCLKPDGATCITDTPIETEKPDGYAFSPEGSIYFTRITGTTPPKEIIITDKAGKHTRKVTISDNLLITITKI